MQVAAEKQDGRHARQDKNRKQIVTAMTEIIVETGSMPSIDQVAERAEVSRRSVFRIFEERTLLIRETVSVMYQFVHERYPIPDLMAFDENERIERFAEYLGQIYEYITPFRRVVEKTCGDDPIIHEQRNHFRTTIGAKLYDSIKLMARPNALKSSVFIESVQLVTSWQAWDQLRSGLRLDIQRAQATVAYALRSILSQDE
jgi:AcrR family transcriptional regulator